MAGAKQIGLGRLKHFWPLYFLVLPSIILVGTFAYSPAISAIYHSFFRWDGGQTNEWVGLNNYTRALQDQVFLESFYMLFLLVFSALFKMVLPIVTAVCIHRLTKDKWQYRYRVLFVIPMIIPIWVRVLLWKFFYDPTLGPLNKLLEGTGLVYVLQFLDWFMPATAAFLQPMYTFFINPLFGGLSGLFLFGFFVLLASRGIEGVKPRAFFWFALGTVGSFFLVSQPWYLIFFAAAALVFGEKMLTRYGAMAGPDYIRNTGIGVLAAAVIVLLATRVWNEPTGQFSTTIERPVLQEQRTVEAPAEGQWTMPADRQAAGWTVLEQKSDPKQGRFVIEAPEGVVDDKGKLKTEQWRIVDRTDGKLNVARYADAVTGKPLQASWLGSSKLVRFSVIFYGFPWVGVFGVLIYLAGLQNIPQDVYEAADLDGIGWFRKFTRIELPLITTQVRLNLVLMIIGTIKQYALVLVMVDPGGGPGGVAQVPGLYMFQQAFRYGEAGYASAIGIILFVLILALTLVNQRYVRVEK